MLVQFISNSGNSNWNISQSNHGVRVRTSSLPALHHQHSSERKKSMHNRKLVTTVSSAQLLNDNTHCISILTRFLGNGTLYVSGQCMEGGRGYRGRQGSKSLPLPLASRPHFKIITSRAQLNIIHVFRTSLLSSTKKGVCYEWTENFGAVQFSSGQASGWFAFTNCQKWPHQ